MPLCLSLLCLLLWPLLAGAADTTLLGITKGTGITSTQLVLELTALPVYRMTTSGQRLDLLLSRTAAAGTVGRLPEDDVIVKVLLAQRGEDLMVSFLLRRAPTRALATTLPGQGRITLDLIWDQEQSATRPAIAFAIPGLPGVRPNGATATPGLHSSYAGR